MDSVFQDLGELSEGWYLTKDWAYYLSVSYDFPLESNYDLYQSDTADETSLCMPGPVVDIGGTVVKTTR